MCGRFVIARSIDDFLVDVGAVPAARLRDLDLRTRRENWNVAPTAEVPIVLERVAGDDDAVPGTVLREVHVARWGLIPGWAKEASIGARAFNARSETVMDKPMFRSAVRHRRCAVPANGYYEWKKRLGPNGQPVKATKDTPAKQPYYIHPADPGETIWFAGLYEWWRDPQETWILSCSILTTRSPSPESVVSVLADLGRLHDRLPIALTRESMDDWLDPGSESRDDAAALVDRLRSEAEQVPRTWQLDPVGAAVGNVRNNDPGLIEPVQALF